MSIEIDQKNFDGEMSSHRERDRLRRDAMRETREMERERKGIKRPRY